MPRSTPTKIPPATAEVKVKPSRIIKSEVIQLAPPDQFMVRIYLPFILCFRLNAPADPRKVYWELQCGLSDALAEFPFYAGQLVLSDAVRDRLEIRVSSEDGVCFKYNDLTSSKLQPPFPTFNDLEQEHFPASKLDPSLAFMDQIFPTSATNPCLLLQANFIEGGLLLAFRPHHSISDFAGWTTFLRSWAKNTAAAAKGTRIPPNTYTDVLDRSPLFHTTKDIPLKDCVQLTTVDDPSELVAAQIAYINALPEVYASCDIVNAYWYFSASHLRALKSVCQPPNPVAEPWISTNDALCRLLWRHVSLARQLPANNNASSIIAIPCNVRRRLTPPLPPDYVGNALLQAHFACTLSELYSSAPDSLYRTASAIRAAINRVDDRTIRGVYGAINALPKIGAAKYNVDFWPGPDFLITTLAKDDWYGLDWGRQLGKLVRKRMTFFHIPCGFIVEPRDADGGLEVFTAMESEVLERLKADQTFMQFAELRCA